MKYAALALLLVGCLDVPSGPAPMCQRTSDCDSAAGEVCEEGVCYGNPPAGAFALTLVPPADRMDLAATELLSETIPSDGWLGKLAFATPVTISGRVDAFCPMPGTCSGGSVGATVTVTRPSRIPGGPPFRAVVTAKDGIPGRTDSFSVQVPHTQDGDPPYVVTVRPDDISGTAPDTTLAPAQVVPPLRMTVTATEDVATDVVLGGAAPPMVTGVVTDDQGRPLSGYRVVALGRWDTSAAASEVSTVAYTGTDGAYTLLLADGVVGNVELVARPPSDTVAPELHVGGIAPGDTPHTIAQPYGLGSSKPFTVTVKGQSGSGEVDGVAGAQVLVSATYTQNSTTHTSTVFTASATTGADGTATLSLLDGSALAGSYQLSVIPPAGSSLAVQYDQALTADALTHGTYLAQLANRLALRGVVLDAQGQPVPNVSVTARPSLRFTWNLDADGQQFLAQIPAATAVTPATGEFVVWVDPLIASVWGSYDLALDPAKGSTAPAWMLPDVELPRQASATSFSVDGVVLPPAANVHGELVDPAGNPVKNGDLRIYQTVPDTSLCTQVAHPPSTCAIPARLEGEASSDEAGTVRLTLPRP